MGFRAGLLIGALGVAVVALGIAVLILATDSDEETTPTSQERTIVERPESSCRFDSMGGQVEVEFSDEGVECSEARAVYGAYKETVSSGDAAGVGETTEVAGWGCEEFPLADYPLIVRCGQGSRRFAVVGTAATAHPHQGPPPSPGSSEPVFFQTPSGNIACALQSEGVRCDISERDWSPPPIPRGCTLDWGHAIELHRNGPTFVCAGDTVADADHPVLPYGEGAAVGSFFCESQKQKLLCVNVRTQHGFWLSIQEVNLF